MGFYFGIKQWIEKDSRVRSIKKIAELFGDILKEYGPQTVFPTLISPNNH